MASVEEQILLATYPASTVYLAVQFMREKNHPPLTPPLFSIIHNEEM